MYNRLHNRSQAKKWGSIMKSIIFKKWHKAQNYFLFLGLLIVPQIAYGAFRNFDLTRILSSVDNSDDDDISTLSMLDPETFNTFPDKHSVIQATNQAMEFAQLEINQLRDEIVREEPSNAIHSINLFKSLTQKLDEAERLYDTIEDHYGIMQDEIRIFEKLKDTNKQESLNALVKGSQEGIKAIEEIIELVKTTSVAIDLNEKKVLFLFF